MKTMSIGRKSTETFNVSSSSTYLFRHKPNKQ